MNKLGPHARVAALAGLMAAVAGSVSPVLAGPAEVALLKSYEGNWKGSGPLVGAETETVTCRMALTPGNADKVNYAGRCAMAGANLAINGTLAYIEESQRYEGAMTSNVNFSGVAVGQKSGNGITFNLQSVGTDQGATIQINAGITLLPGSITVDFKATDLATGKVVYAKVPFARS